MDWSNERYVRLYIRDTKTWMKSRWEGQCLLMMLLRKVDLAGVIDNIDDPVDDLALMTGLPVEHVKVGLEKLMDAGAVEINSENQLILPNFIEAQEASKSDRQRQKESRDRRRRDALVTKRDKKSQVVTGGHKRSLVTDTGSRSDTDTDHKIDEGLPPVASPPRKPAKKTKRKTNAAKSTETWNAYARAYLEKYGTAPVRNARTNALCCQLVDRLGATEAPLVAAWYLRSGNNYYATRGHSLAILVGDAEKVRTEWATGKQTGRPRFEFVPTEPTAPMTPEEKEEQARIVAEITGSGGVAAIEAREAAAEKTKQLTMESEKGGDDEH